MKPELGKVYKLSHSDPDKDGSGFFGAGKCIQLNSGDHLHCFELIGDSRGKMEFREEDIIREVYPVKR